MSSNNSCVFCKIIRGEIKSELIMESFNFIVIKDNCPKVEGHCLVIPKKHYVTLLDIPDDLGSELLEVLKKVSGRFIDEKRGDGFNVIMNNLECAGQSVNHAHIHLIPRKENDCFKLGI
jgi:histidine triad (HIT) family protein